MIEDYDSQMPFRFTGTLEKLTIELAPQSMSTEDQRELERRQPAGAIATESKKNRSPISLGTILQMTGEGWEVHAWL